MKYLLISTGCAECWSGSGEPLIGSTGPFDTVEEAKSKAWHARSHGLWEDHPQGGWFTQSGQGEDWVLPVPDDMPTIFKPYEESS